MENDLKLPEIMNQVMDAGLYPEMAVQIVNKAKGRNNHLPIHW